MNEPHVCRYLELLPNGAYYCGGCNREYRLAVQHSAVCECIPLAPRPYNFCQDCGGRIAVNQQGDL